MRQRTRIYLICFATVGVIIGDLIALRAGLMQNLFWAYLSVGITLAGYSIYISQMYPDTAETSPVKPHPLSWIGFGLLTAAGWLIQVAQGGEAGSWCLGVTAFACVIIGSWSAIRFPFRINRRGIIVAATGAILFAVSLATRNIGNWATVSAVAATLADLALYEPTFRRGWSSPHEESATNFVFNSLKCAPALLALDSYSVATTVYLFMLLVVNGGFAVCLFVRRASIARDG